MRAFARPGHVEDCAGAALFATPPTPLPSPVRQQESLHWMVAQEATAYRGSILADEMGMGKTIPAGLGRPPGAAAAAAPAAAFPCDALSSGPVLARRAARQDAFRRGPPGRPLWSRRAGL